MDAVRTYLDPNRRREMSRATGTSTGGVIALRPPSTMLTKGSGLDAVFSAASTAARASDAAEGRAAAQAPFMGIALRPPANARRFLAGLGGGSGEGVPEQHGHIHVAAAVEFPALDVNERPPGSGPSGMKRGT